MNISLCPWARIAFFFGIAAFLLVGIMAAFGSNLKPAVYPNEKGYPAAMYWFERVESVGDLFGAIGDPSSADGVRIRRAMDAVNRIDFAFMIAYSALFACLFVLMVSMLKAELRRVAVLNVLLSAGLIFSLVMLVGDIFENVQLLNLTKAANKAEVDVNIIARLMFFTRLKWFSIFFASIGLSVLCTFFGRENWRWYILACIYAASGIIGFVSFFVPPLGSMLVLSANLMGAGWLISVIHAGTIAFRKNKS